MKITSQLLSWKALTVRSKELARHLEKKQFTTEKEWASYQTVAYRLIKQFAALSKICPDLKTVTPLKKTCAEALKTIEVRLRFFHPQKKQEVQRELYLAKRQHYETRLEELKKKLKRATQVSEKHHTLFIPQSKTRELQAEIEIIRKQLSLLD